MGAGYFGKMLIAAMVAICTASVPILAQIPKPANDASQSTAATTPAPVRPPRISTEKFAALPSAIGPELSPDGAHIAYRVQWNGTSQLIVRNVDSDAKRGFNIPDTVELTGVQWAGNNRLLLRAVTMLNFGGFEVPATSLLVYDVTSGAALTIGKKGQGLEGDDVLYVDPNGQYILLSLAMGLFAAPDVYKVTLADGIFEKIESDRDDVSEWYADRAGVVRVGIGYRGRTLQILYRSAAGQPLKPIAKLRKSDSDDEVTRKLYAASAIAAGSDEGFVLSDEKTGRDAVYRFNLVTQQVGEEIYAHDQFDVRDFRLSEDGKTIDAVALTDDQDRVLWLDPKMAALNKRLGKIVPEHNLTILSRSRDGNRMLILGDAPNDPGLFYLFDKSKGELRRFVDVQAALPPEWLATTKPVRYDARDKTSIPAYLTVPKGRDAKNLPLIILPHGGPYGVRDKMQYDAEVQMLANRGYAVLQPNFRGSGGYGKAFVDSGKGQIGRAMQDDLDDGMDWLVREGIADPKRVCVMGSSYGGYAAVWAITRNPERYRCAISYAGVMDWANMLKYDRKFFDKSGFSDWSARVKGDPNANLDEYSPYRLAGKITRPLLLGHGDEDFTVPIAQSKKLVSAMKDAGRTQALITYKGEGHGFSDRKNFEDWLNKVDAFLATHNPSDFEPRFH
jgi:dienelactone hydrolase